MAGGRSLPRLKARRGAEQIMKNLVVGVSFTGAVLAERIASQSGEPVVLIDQLNHIAGNAFDCFDDHGS